MKNLKTFDECMRAYNEGLGSTKTFADLKEGDSLYIWYMDKMKNPMKLKVLDSKIDEWKINITVNKNIEDFKYDNKNVVSFNPDYKSSTTYFDNDNIRGLVFISTNEKDFLDELKARFIKAPIIEDESEANLEDL